MVHRYYCTCSSLIRIVLSCLASKESNLLFQGSLLPALKLTKIFSRHLEQTPEIFVGQVCLQNTMTQSYTGTTWQFTEQHTSSLAASIPMNSPVAFRRTSSSYGVPSLSSAVADSSGIVAGPVGFGLGTACLFAAFGFDIA